MLREEVQGEERDRFIRRVELETQRFVDPGLEGEAMLELAVKMDKAGMLKTAAESLIKIGLFTVVKKIIDGKAVQRLILDMRQGNQCWKRPPWTAMGGASAVAQTDFSSVEEPMEN